MNKPQQPSVELGNRLRRVRELNGLSQRELARRAGVTNSSVSMIEQGLVSPSVSSLARLLEVIPISLAQFFAYDPNGDDARVYPAKSLPTQSGPGTGIRLSTLPLDTSYPQVTLSRFRYSAHSDSAECETGRQSVLGWLVEGQLELTVGARRYEPQHGDGFYIPPGQVYRIRNPHEQEAVAIVLCEDLL